MQSAHIASLENTTFSSIAHAVEAVLEACDPDEFLCTKCSRWTDTEGPEIVYPDQIFAPPTSAPIPPTHVPTRTDLGSTILVAVLFAVGAQLLLHGLFS